MAENLYGKTRDELGALLAPLTARAFHARQLFGWLYARGASDFSAMSNLPRPLREALAGRFAIRTPAPDRREQSTDGTVKYRLRLEDGRAVESVYIPEARRITFCISSQVGCPLGCEFCLTAKMGLVRNLTPGEIAGQVAVLAEEHALAANDYNIVFMGMGEPLNNYSAVMSAFRLLTDPEGFGIAPRHITLSTAGVIPGIRKLSGEPIRPRLAVSLSATTDELRDRLMPINRAYPLADLFQAIREFPLAPRQRVTLEYVLLRGLNDTPEDASRLATLVGTARVKVNLIPFNEGAGIDFSPPPAGGARAFRDRLVDCGIPASLRKRRGADISAACGQLAILDQEGPGDPAPAGSRRNDD